MKSALIGSVLILLLLSAVSVPVDATATPILELYFDRALTQQHANCPEAPAGSVLDTLYLVASGFDTPLEGIEYKIEFPPEIIWLGELESNDGLWMGTPDQGRTMAFFTPQDASGRVVIQEFVILWLCEGCATTNITIEFAPHPMTGSLRAVTSDLVFEEVIGFPSYVCGLVVGNTPELTTTTPRAVPMGPAAEECVLVCPASDGGVILPGDPPSQLHTVDLNGDNLVDIVDFATFAQPYMAGMFDPDMDFYCSDNLDLIDFVLFTRHWLHTGSVPVEHSTWGEIKERYSD